MQSINLDNKLKGSRRFKQKTLEYCCRASIYVTLIIMLIFFSSLFYRGLGAFFQTKILIPIHTIENNTNVTINNALYNLVEETTPVIKKSLRGLITPSSYYNESITEPGTYKFTAHTDIDMYYKKVYDKLDNTQRSVVDDMINQGMIFKVFNFDFWTKSDSRSPEVAGLQGAVIGTLFTIGIAILIAFPIGLGCAVQMEEFTINKGRYHDFMEININNLAAVPSVVYGLLGLAVFINLLEFPRSASLVGALTLSVLILPTIIITSRTALRTVPQSIRDASNALGASRMQTVINQVVPAAMPGIITGAIIAIARGIGESAPLIMIGMVAFIMSTPSNVLDPATTLPVQIFLWADSPERGFAEKTSAAIIVLLTGLIILNSFAIWLRKRFEIKW